MLLYTVNKPWLRGTLALLSMSIFVERTTATSCRRQLTRQTINYRDCLPKRILTRSCIGSCVTSAQISPTNPLQITHSCFQCKEAIVRQKKVRLTCPNPEGPQPLRKILIEVPVPLECMCEPCSFNDVIGVTRSNSDGEN